jgi:hypothetical protein
MSRSLPWLLSCLLLAAPAYAGSLASDRDACRAAFKGSGKMLRGTLRLKQLPDVTEALLPMP